jgi:hypothetical protein
MGTCVGVAWRGAAHLEVAWPRRQAWGRGESKDAPGQSLSETGLGASMESCRKSGSLRVSRTSLQGRADETRARRRPEQSGTKQERSAMAA